MSRFQVSERWMKYGVWLAVLGYLIVVVRSAWLADDAFITYRTIDNFIHGFGLRWNVIERVQTFTHPLWMLLIAIAYAATGEIYYTALLVSIAVSLGAVLVLVWRVAPSPASRWIGLAAIVSSKAFVDYSTSGLENPLTHLLLGLFVWVYQPPPTSRRFSLMALVAGLAVLNRMDSVLLFLPALAREGWRVGLRRAIRPVAVGWFPFAAWELFSLCYYGFLFPNTAYAKLGNGLTIGALVSQGGYYLLHSLKCDPLTVAVIAASTGLFLWNRAWRFSPLVFGMGLYLFYTVWIGGDFMGGRFLAAPFFLAVCLLVRQAAALDAKRGLLGAVCLLLVGLLPAQAPLRTGSDYGVGRKDVIDAHGIADERMYYYPHSGLLRALSEEEAFPNHPWAKSGKELEETGSLDTYGMLAPTVDGERIVTIWGTVGYFGFFSGPRIHIVDPMAITDPLLARIPPYENPNWRPGHLDRLMPEGYVESQIEERNLLGDPDLARYYDALCLIMRGAVFSGDRWRAIWKMNAGGYDELIDADFFRHPSPLERCLSGVRLTPERPLAYADLAEQYFAEGMTGEAIGALEEAARLGEEDFDLQWKVGNLYHANGLQERALERYRQVVRIGDFYLSQIEEGAIAADSFPFAAYMRLAHAYESIGDMPAAIEALKRGLERRAAGGEGPVGASAEEARDILESLHQAAFGLMQRREWDAAVAFYRLLLEENGLDITARVNLGWCLYEKGNYSQAVEEYRRALAAEPNSAAQFNLGLALLARGDVEGAEEEYARAVSEFGAAEGRRIGAVEDLRGLIGRGVQATRGREILRRFWPE